MSIVNRAPGAAFCALACLLLASCGSVGDSKPLAALNIDTPIRLLLTFDDGPSTWQPDNPTSAVLDQLAANPIQPGIKAVFLLQTRDPRAGASSAGKALMRRQQSEGHLLALHSGSPRGHASHVRMSSEELAKSLKDGRSDIRSITGKDATLVRPPFWSFDERTRKVYRENGFDMLLTDINARDGKIYGWTISLRRRSHFLKGMKNVREAIEQGKIKSLDGVIPVVITFHDTNRFTASHMREYLEILVETTQAVGLPLADPPFYNDRAQIEHAATVRARTGSYAGDP
ncbi:MAG: polysaccharide deacetylase family protein [Betaproteobacteria bacterium]